MVDAIHLNWWRRAWERWKRIATVVGDFQARVVLSLFYFVIVLPFGLAVRIFSDPLKLSKKQQAGWTDFAERTQTVEEARKQF